MHLRSFLLGLACILALEACSSPLPAPAGRDVMILVSNRSNADVDLTYVSETPASVSGGSTTVGACMSLLVTFGGVHERIAISINGSPIADLAMPAGANGYLVIPVFVAVDDVVSVGAPALLPDPPNEPPAPQGCGT